MDNVAENLATEEQELDGFYQELSQLVSGMEAVETYGVNPTALAVMQTTGLLVGTSLNAIAVEIFSNDSPDGDETHFALESLMEKVKDKAAQWSAKILTLVQKAGSRIEALLNRVWEKTSAALYVLKDKADQAIKDGVTTIKAHPYQTAAVVVTALAAVGAVVAFSSTNLPGAGSGPKAIAAFTDRVKSMTNAIHWPLGKLEASVTEAGKLSLAPASTKTFPPSVLNKQQAGFWAKSVRLLIDYLAHAIKLISRAFVSLTIKAAHITKDVAVKALWIGADAVNHIGNKTGRAVLEKTGSKVLAGTASAATKYTVGSSSLMIVYYNLGNILSFCFALIVRTVDHGCTLIYNSATGVSRSI